MQSQQGPSLPAADSCTTRGQSTDEDSNEVLRNPDAGSCDCRNSETYAASSRNVGVRRRASAESCTDKEYRASDGRSQRVTSRGGSQRIRDHTMHVRQNRAQGGASELLPSDRHKDDAADSAESGLEAVDRLSSVAEKAASSTHLNAAERTETRLPYPSEQQLFDASRRENARTC